MLVTWDIGLLFLRRKYLPSLVGRTQTEAYCINLFEATTKVGPSQTKYLKTTTIDLRKDNTHPHNSMKEDISHINWSKYAT